MATVDRAGRGYSDHPAVTRAGGTASITGALLQTKLLHLLSADRDCL
jgi:hypothetical protein